MKIIKFLKESYIDYPGKISTVVFNGSCNYECSACHAKDLFEDNERVDEKEFFNYLDSTKDWIEAVVLCGGEPTLELGLVNFARKLKKRNLAVKLDTNGSNYEKLLELKKEKLIDYVAMDIKGPKNLYNNLVGEKVNLENIEKSMKITQNFPNYEFRTTVVPIIRDHGLTCFMNTDEAEEMAKWIVDVTGKNKHKHYLQKFVPRKNELLDSRLEEFPEPSESLLKGMKAKIIRYLPNCEIRNEN